MTTPQRGGTQKRPWLKILTPIVITLAVIIGSLSFIRSSVQKNRANGVGDPNPVDTGAVLDDFQFEKLEGGMEKLSELNSKLLLVNFWASWCEACMIEMPSLVKLREKYHAQGFEILGIDLDENPQAAAPPVMKQFKMAFPQFVDPNGVLSDRFDIHAIPVSVILDSSRRVLWIENGERDWFDKDSQKQIEGWLKK